ncbi:hypothetical protein J6590_019383 [Homalodisca vitripennis]|nr:hypothetical protein J6590_019383 [Homalodisca vitripennis]
MRRASTCGVSGWSVLQRAVSSRPGLASPLDSPNTSEFHGTSPFPVPLSAIAAPPTALPGLRPAYVRTFPYCR